MSNFSLKLNDEQINKLKATFSNDIKANPNEYIDTFIQNDNLTISIYKSKKVVFQGNDAFYYAQSFINTKKIRQAGSDEVGTGDYFGPIVVVASIVEIEDYPFIEENGITDSKQMDDNKIKKLAPILKDKFKHTILILEPNKYNEVYQKIPNMNAIKAKMHNQAYLNLRNKGYDLPKACYVDEFARSDLYFNYLSDEKEIYRDLIFETKAEEKYASVAIASCIARYTFLDYMEKMEKKYALSFHKGAGKDTDLDIKSYVDKYGKDKLNLVAKLNFKNTNNV